MIDACAESCAAGLEAQPVNCFVDHLINRGTITERERERSIFFRGYRYALRDQDTT
jgi:hypothetical protein